MKRTQPSATIAASGATGSLVTLVIILTAVFAPTYYARLPPGGGETLVVVISTLVGYFKEETILKIKRRLP